MAGHDIMTPEGKRLLKHMGEIVKLQVRVGFQDDGKVNEETGARLLDIAAWNELGTATSPSRPFLRKSVDENKERIHSFNNAVFNEFITGKETVPGVLKKIGDMQKGLIQEKITDGEFAPNANSYVESLRKKSDGKDFNKKPLILTGRLQQSVSFVIKKRGED